MKNRACAIFSICVIASLLLTACGAPAAFQCTDKLGCVTISPSDPLHIAFWGILSGVDGSLGEDSKRGVELAIADMGGKFQGHDILLTTLDAGCTPEGGAAAATKLAADPTLVGLIGPSCSDETAGGIAIITKAGLTTIAPSNTRPALTAADRGPEFAGYLRTSHSDAIQGKAVAEFAFKTLKVTKAATLHDKSLYAQALQQVFADEFIKLGGKIVAQESAAKDATDIKPVLATIAAAGPELLYFPVFVSLGGNVVTQVRSVPGLEKVKLIASGSTFSPEFLKAGGPNSKGVYLSSPDFSAFTGDYAGLIKKHTAKYGGPTLSTYHAHAYDATNIMFTALAKVAVVDTDGSLHVGRQALRAAIFATKDFQGITGNLTCSPTGDCGAPVIAVYEIINADPASWNPAEGVNPKKIWP